MGFGFNKLHGSLCMYFKRADLIFRVRCFFQLQRTFVMQSPFCANTRTDWKGRCAVLMKECGGDYDPRPVLERAEAWARTERQNLRPNVKHLEESGGRRERF